VLSANDRSPLSREDARALDDRIRNIESFIDRVDRLTVNLSVFNTQSASANASVIIDMNAAARDLAVLIEQARQSPRPQPEEIATLTAARDAALQGDEADVVRNLRKIGSYVMGLVREISVPVVQALIEKHMGLT
jgi:hypothetical protein